MSEEEIEEERVIEESRVRARDTRKKRHGKNTYKKAGILGAEKRWGVKNKKKGKSNE